MRRAILCLLSGIVMLPSAADAYWVSRSETMPSGKSSIRAIAGDPGTAQIIFACEDERISFTVKVWTGSSQANVTLVVSFDDGPEQSLKPLLSRMPDGLAITVSPEDARSLALQAIGATRKFAVAAVFGGGAATFKSSQTMTGAPNAIGAVLNACRQN